MGLMRQSSLLTLPPKFSEDLQGREQISAPDMSWMVSYEVIAPVTRSIHDQFSNLSPLLRT